MGFSRDWLLLGAAAVAGGQHGANHELELVKHQQGQHHGASHSRGEKNLGHGDATGQAFLATAEHDGDLVLLAESEPACQLGGGIQNDRKQHDADAQQTGKGPKRGIAPEPAGHCGAEGGIDHQQNGALVKKPDEVCALRDPFGCQRTRKMAQREWQQQLQHDRADMAPRIMRGRGARCRIDGLRHDQPVHQKRRNEDTQQGAG